MKISNLSNGNWTIDFWAYNLAGTNGVVLGQTNGNGAGAASWGINIGPAFIAFQAATGTGSWNIANIVDATYLASAVQQHIAFVCTYPTFKIYRDGIFKGDKYTKSSYSQCGVTIDNI